MRPLPSLRILIAHCFYQYRGGEDSVVEAETKMLRHHGHEVYAYARNNADIPAMNKLVAASQALWSSQTYREIADLIHLFKPDVIHAHNTFPLVSPSLYWSAQRHGVPVVQTLHNFRLLCPQAMFLRDDAPCERCLGKFPWRGIVHRCYRDSMSQSSVLAGMLVAHRTFGTYRKKVSRYIALTEFSRSKFVEGGLPADRIVIKPNFVDIESAPETPRDGGLFVGRLSREKGIFVLLDALAHHPKLLIDVIGIGPLESLMTSCSQVRLQGWKEQQGVYETMRRASYLVLPSLWYENFPRTLVEAFACGLPVIASRFGSMLELVEDGNTGLLFEVGSGADLAEKISWAESHPEEMRRMGVNARRVYEAKFTSRENYRQLMEIYRGAIEESKAGQVKWAMHG